MNEYSKPIRGRVARVLSSRDVAINRGSNDGVKVGMIFRILSPKGSEISDPDTGEMLGSVEITKVRVKVTSVQERIAVASTYRERSVNVGGTGVGVGISRALFEPPKWETHVETLKLDDAIVEELSERDTFVHTGDPVVQDLDDP